MRLLAFGEPGGAGPWGWRFGGHHVSLNNLVVDGRLVATLGGPRMSLIARDQTTFGVAEQPGTTLTFRIEQDKVAGVALTGMGNTVTFNRTGEK